MGKIFQQYLLKNLCLRDTDMAFLCILEYETTQVGKSCELLVLLYAARLANLQDMLYMLQDSRTSSQDCKKIIYYMLQDSRTTF